MDLVWGVRCDRERRGWLLLRAPESWKLYSLSQATMSFADGTRP